MSFRSVGLLSLGVVVALSFAACGGGSGSGGTAGQGAGHAGGGATGTAGHGAAGTTGTAGSGDDAAAGTMGAAGAEATGTAGGGGAGGATTDGSAGGHDALGDTSLADGATEHGAADGAAGAGDAADASTDSTGLDAAADAGPEVMVPNYCDTFPNLATAITETLASGFSDTSAGGTIVPGTYVATSRTYYGAGVHGMWRQTLYLRADHSFVDVHDDNNTIPSGGGTFTTNGATMTVDTPCPALPLITYHYTATSSTVTLFEATPIFGGNPQHVTVYTKQ